MKSFFQTAAWAKFKEKSGWQAEQFGRFLGIKKGLPLSQNMLYFPELPSDQSSSEIAQAIIASLKPKGQTFVRLEFLEPFSIEAAQKLKKIGLRKSFEEVQPEHRLWIDLRPSVADILAQMKPKGRYNIRLAEKHQLEIERGSSPELVRRFFQLYSATSQRQEFSGRGEHYFQQLVEMLKAENVGEVLLVRLGQQDLAGAIILYYDEIASYLYGGSGGDQSLMAPYLLHWEAIRTAKNRGLKTYDLLAVAPPESRNHPYAGLSRFKSQFGGQTVTLLGSWDLVGRPFWYKMYQLAERARRRRSTT